MPSEPKLRRNISFPLLVLYGLGTTVGAGIYALTGEVVGAAGSAAPLAFLLAAGLAGLTALSFAQLSARYPRSAGEAVYMQNAFGAPKLATITGLLVALSGCVSAATITNGFAGYLGGLVDLPRAVSIAGVTLVLTGIAAWGIRSSLRAAGAVTLLEIGGLLLVIWSARGALTELPARLPELFPGAPDATWPGTFAAALLAFYAFLGFEDMVNVAEEVKEVRRNLPRAIGLTLLITTLLYLLVATAAVLGVAPAELAQSEDPLVHLYRAGGGRAPKLISTIAVFALLNGALVQVVMASRVLYGLAGKEFVPSALGRVHPRTATPLLATSLSGALVLGLALFFPLRELAVATSLITLIVFTMINAALLQIRLREESFSTLARPATWLTVAGLAFTASFFVYSLWETVAG